MSFLGTCERRLRSASKTLGAAVVLASLTLAAFAVPAGAATPPQAAANAPHITYGVQPGLRTVPDSSRADFSYNATPGARINDYIAIRNYAVAPVTLQTYPGDAFNGPTGAFDILRRNQKSKDLGAWIRLKRASVTIPGRGFVIIPFTVSIPANAIPGDHDAGIVAAIITQQLRSNGSKVNVEERVGARVRVRISGPLKPELLIRSLKVKYTGSASIFGAGRATVSYDVANTGNVILSTSQRVQLSAMIGGTKQTPAMAAITSLLPGSSLHESVTFKNVSPGIRLKATVTLDPKSLPAAPVTGLKEIRKSASTWAVPWILVGLIVLLLVVLLALRWWLRRRSRRRAAIVETPPRELVGAAVGGGAAPSSGADPIDLRDMPPLEVDVRDRDHGRDNDVIDLPKQHSADGDQPDPGSPPSSNPRRK